MLFNDYSSMLNELLNARKEVIKDDLSTFKLCGREKAEKLINVAFNIDERINPSFSNSSREQYGRMSFVNIKNVNKLVNYLQSLCN